VDSLVLPLLSILDTAAKQQLLLDVRRVIQAADLNRFDRIVAANRDKSVKVNRSAGRKAHSHEDIVSDTAGGILYIVVNKFYANSLCV